METASKSKLTEKHPFGESWYKELAEKQGHNTFIVAFSRGKDSLATSLALLNAGYNLVPVTYIGVPNLSFVEDTLDYYERKLFKRHIVRALYPHMADLIMEGQYLPPNLLANAEETHIDVDQVLIQEHIIYQEDLPDNTMTAIGIRVSDNLMRRMLVSVNGPVVRKKNQFYAIWDWNIARVIETISRSGIKLPMDYQIWQHSFFELTPEFLIGVRANWPSDYRKILEYFPLAEAEIFRYEMNRK